MFVKVAIVMTRGGRERERRGRGALGKRSIQTDLKKEEARGRERERNTQTDKKQRAGKEKEAHR